MPLYPMRFAFKAGTADRIEAVITVPEEKRNIVHGTVYDSEGNKVKDAIVRLFLDEERKLFPVTQAFTDEEGEFVFGPLYPDQNYIIKVYAGGVKLREMAIRPGKKKAKLK